MLERLGPYLIDEQIGKGGMGFVYSARHEDTDSRVAVKMLSNAFADDHSFRDRFQQEVETLQQLQHPGIVQIIGYGQEEEVLYYAMELVKGRTLFQILKESGPFTWRDVIRITIDICHALKHAHDRGVIHRDLKPSNLFLTEDDQVKLVDFGIARLFGATQLTADHAVVGTADYMAPEQAEGARPTIKSDLYSLGSVMYALLTGRPPFASPSVAQVIHKLKYDQPLPITETIADVPMELDYIVRQLLSKRPDHRIPTPLAVAHRLQAMQHALEARIPVKTANSTTEMSGADDRTNEEATMEFASSQKKPFEGDEVTIEGHYLSEIQNLPEDSDTQADSSLLPQQQAEKQGGKTHYIPIERDRFKSNDESPTGIFASLLVLVVLVVGLGALLAFTNWYNQPRTADELLEIIEEARITPGSDWGQASREMQEFLERFPDHQQFPTVETHYNGLKDERNEQRFLKSLESDLKELPIAKVTLRQILESENLSPDELVNNLEHFVTLYESRRDSEVAECVAFARQKIKRLKREHSEFQRDRLAILKKTETEIREVLAFCRNIAPEQPEAALGFLEAIYEIHKLNEGLTELLNEVLTLRRELSKESVPSGD